MKTQTYREAATDEQLRRAAVPSGLEDRGKRGCPRCPGAGPALGAARGESWRRCNHGWRCLLRPRAWSRFSLPPAPSTSPGPVPARSHVSGEPVTPCDKEPGQSGGGRGSQSERAWPPQRRRVTYQQECWARGHPVGPWLPGMCGCTLSPASLVSRSICETYHLSVHLSSQQIAINHPFSCWSQMSNLWCAMGVRFLEASGTF